MRQKVLNLTNNLADRALAALLYLGLVWVCLALSFQVFMVYLQFSGKVETTQKIVNWFTWTFDGNFNLKIKLRRMQILLFFYLKYLFNIYM